MLSVVSEQRPAVRRIETEALKALAHPLRVRLYSELTTYGPATASALAARLEESSGATSYHLRQLEKHGFVREDPERGNGRDRWWERVPGVIDLEPGPATRDAGDLIELELARLAETRFRTFLSERDSFGAAWTRVAQSSSATLVLTAEELAELDRRVLDVIDDYRGRPEDGRERVDVQFRAYPVRPPGRGDG